MRKTMRAVVIEEPGGPEALTLREVPRPLPGRGEVLVRVRTSGINRADLLQRRGGYPAPPGAPADIPGLEYAGEVAEVGGGVAAVRPGDRVMGLVGGGGYAQFVLAHERTVVPVPDGLSVVEAGAVPEVYMTAFDAVFLQAGLASGETLLIHAVGSGVGTAAVQLAATAGARTLGTSRTPEKLERAAELGLEEGVVGGDADWAEAVLDATDGRGVDVILDLVGAPYLERNLRVLGQGARWIVVGVTGGASGAVDLRRLMGRRASITGTVLRARPLEEKAGLARIFGRRIVPGFAAGRYRPVVDDIYPPGDAAAAHRRMEENRTFGKLLLDWR